MPAQAGIHDFSCCQQQSRGWRAFARHDVKAVPMGQPIGPVVLHQPDERLTYRHQPLLLVMAGRDQVKPGHDSWDGHDGWGWPRRVDASQSAA